MTDEQLIRELTASQNSLYAFILTLLPDTSAAGDVLQETHVEMWRKRREFVAGTNFRAWACRIAQFKVREYRAAAARDRLVFDEHLVEQLAVDAQQHADAGSEQADALQECVEELPHRQRDLLSRRYAPGGSVKRLAEELGRSAQGLAVTLFRIRQALLECVQRKLSEGARA